MVSSMTSIRMGSINGMGWWHAYCSLFLTLKEEWKPTWTGVNDHTFGKLNQLMGCKSFIVTSRVEIYYMFLGECFWGTMRGPYLLRSHYYGFTVDPEVWNQNVISHYKMMRLLAQILWVLFWILLHETQLSSGMLKLEKVHKAPCLPYLWAILLHNQHSRGM